MLYVNICLPASANSSSPKHCWYTSRASWSSAPLSSYKEGRLEVRQQRSESQHKDHDSTKSVRAEGDSWNTKNINDGFTRS